MTRWRSPIQNLTTKYATYNIDKLNTELGGNIDKLSAEIKEYIERRFRQQLWAIVALFVPLYLALLGFFWAIFNVVKK